MTWEIWRWMKTYLMNLKSLCQDIKRGWEKQVSSKSCIYFLLGRNTTQERRFVISYPAYYARINVWSHIPWVKVGRACWGSILASKVPHMTSRWQRSLMFICWSWSTCRDKVLIRGEITSNTRSHNSIIGEPNEGELDTLTVPWSCIDFWPRWSKSRWRLLKVYFPETNKTN